MSSSPFGCNRKNLFSNKAKEAAPPETVTLIADKSQVITAIIPFSTKQAANIRAHMHANVTYLSHYGNPTDLASKAGYCFTNFASAVQFLVDLTADSLSISPEAFEAGMAGN